MKDQSVPARWRILGIVNGFHINGKDCYASNEWFMSKLGCSQQTVSNGVRELEELGEITCIRTKTKRLIQRKGTNELVGGYKRTRVSDPNQLVPNSISNSISKNTVASAPAIVEVSENPEGRERKAKDEYEVGYEELCKWAESRRGFKFVSKIKQYSALKKARLNGIGPKRLQKRWMELEEQDFFAENGFDFSAVVSSFDRKS